MIKKIDHKNKEAASQIRSVFQASYKVEAKLLGAIDFPPLKRELGSFITSENSFYGFYKGGRIVGVIEVSNTNEETDIHSLIVHPDYFRQGVARQLMQFILEKYNTKKYIVETGLDNVPAISLYEQLGFIQKEQYDTDHGVVKVRLIKLS